MCIFDQLRYFFIVADNIINLLACEITEDLKTTRNYGRLPLNGGFGRTNLCNLTQIK